MEAGRDVRSSMTTTQHARAYREFPSCCAGHPDAKPSPVTFSTSTRACSNAPPTCARNSEAGRSHALPIIETEAQDNFRLHPDQPDFITDGQI